MQRTVPTLEGLTEQEAAVYLPEPNGGFRLHPELVDLLDRQDADLAAADARIVRLTAQIERETADKEIRAALAAAGVNPALRTAVVALFQEQMRVEVRGDPGNRVASVVTPYGPVSVASAVDAWLTGPEGDAYRGKPKVTADGHLTQAMRALRTVH